MTMTSEQIRKLVMTYLEATECQFLEKSPYHVTVKLSPRADRDLTNRPYYWGFIERTGAEPETMSFSFIFDPERHREAEAGQAAGPKPGRGAAAGPNAGKGAAAGFSGNGPAPAGAATGLGGSGPAPAGTAPGLGGAGAQANAPGPGGAAGAGPHPGLPGQSGQSPEDTLLDRYYGPVRPLPILGPGRIQREELTFGSSRLRQIFEAAKRGGRYVYLFEEPGTRQRLALLPAAYEPWLGVCFKVEFCCDMKREELHFFGVSLLSGKIDEAFDKRLSGATLVPRLPENVHIEPTKLTLDAGRAALEDRLSELLGACDKEWSIQARERLRDELEIIEAYYKDLLKDPDEERKQAALNQYEARREEIRWQYEPRIVVSALGCGIFHLRSPR
ncbi:YqhG family protein [Paenibacillus macerans]|uniref:YqhG family protein n=6 Tax=Paenibacillus macerans TaxID=44252 RepID=UPI003D2C3D31